MGSSLVLVSCLVMLIPQNSAPCHPDTKPVIPRKRLLPLSDENLKTLTRNPFG
jgi:hypothetical protein